MYALKFVPINGAVTLDSHVEGDPARTLRKMVEGQEAAVRVAESDRRAAQAEIAALLARVGQSGA